MSGEELNDAPQSREVGRLRKNERRLATLLSNLPGMAYRCRNDKDWTMEFVSDGCEALTGYKSVDFVGGGARSYVSLVHPDDRDRIWNETQEALRQRLPFRLIYRIIAADGREKWVWEQGVGVYSGTELEALEGFITDITERKRAEAAVHQVSEAVAAAEHRYHRMFNSVSDALYVYALREDGLPLPKGFLEVNDLACRLLGYTRKELLQLGVADVVAPEDRAAGPSNARKLLADSQVTWDGSLVTKSGRSVPVEVNTHIFHLNSTLFAISSVRDNTERRRADVALRDSEKLLNISQKVAGLGSYVLDIPMGIWKSSAVLDDIFGINETFIRSVQGWASLVHPEFREQMIQYFTDWVLVKHNRFDKEYKVVRASDGQTRWVHGRGELEFDCEECPIRFSGTIFDITERKRAEEEKAKLEEQFRQAQKLESIGTLAGGVAHDFNNLLTVINGYSDFILDRLKAPDPIRSYAEQIRKAGERAASLTKQLLAFSRNQMIEPRIMDLNATISVSVPMLRRLIGEDIGVETHLDESLGHVMADPDQFYQIIMNLAVNARDAMPDGGKLDIETLNVNLSAEDAALHVDAVPGRYVLMTVTDTGHGMNETVRQQIFEPFFTTKDIGKGTGLGLATVYGIVRQSNGWIDVWSEVGVGTSFSVYLPRIDGSPLPESTKFSALPERGGETVLVVEDQEAVRSFIKTSLEGYGYHVIEAADGEQAVALASQPAEPIDLLLTDVVLTGMHGKKVSERVKQLRPNLKVLFTSGYTGDVISNHGVLDPGVAFLHKPFSPSELAAKIREVLAGPSAQNK